MISKSRGQTKQVFAHMVRHPEYSLKRMEWEKWRDTMRTGDYYIGKYLQKYSNRESDPDFNLRKKYTPIPAFAKAALFEIRNSVFQRLNDVERRQGSDNFRECMAGGNYGVDLHGASMNQFIGITLLEELLSMSKVGVFVDMPRIEGPTLADEVGKRPYYYFYRVEDILSWTWHPDRPDEFSNLLLRDNTEVTDSSLGLPCGTVERVRHLWTENGEVYMEWWLYDETKNEQYRQDFEGETITEPIKLDIPVIPFAMAEISDSLLADVANHQIALMNMESSDIGYLLKSGFPFYTEQRSSMSGSWNFKPMGAPGDTGDEETSDIGKDETVAVGTGAGRYYDQGMDRPDFIHPSSEPITASMAKQSQLKEDIRAIMNLSLSNVKAKMASKESKSMDNQGLEAGLSAIGLELEYLERKLATYWHMYENKPNTPSAVINYPRKYRLTSDEDARKNALAWAELINKVPAPAFRKSMSKKLVFELLGGTASQSELDEIYKQIDDSEISVGDPDIIMQLIEQGVLDLVRAAKIFGVNPKAPADAAKEHAERIARIAASQAPPGTDGGQNAGARGVGDQSADPNAGKKEKAAANDQNASDAPGKTGRGEGKATANSGEDTE